MNMSERIGRRRFWLLLCVGVLVFSAVALLVLRQRTPRGPQLLNEPTKAREAREFGKESDPIVDPLPIEPEKHGK